MPFEHDVYTPPNNAEAEQSVIGSVLIDPKCLRDIADILRPRDFYDERNQIIFQAMLSLDAERRPIDFLTLKASLTGTPHFDLDKLAEHLGVCATQTPYAAHVEHYAKIVREKALLRGIVQAADESIRSVFAGNATAQEILDRAEQSFRDVAGKSDGDLTTAESAAIEVCSFIDSISKQGKHLGVPTGLKAFDEQIGGLFGGEFIIIAARPSVGKSALASQIADWNATSERSTYFASLEMTGRELAIRSICAESGVNSRTIRTGKISERDKKRLVDGIAAYSRRKLIIDTRSSLTVESLGRTIRRLIPQGLKLAIVDYLGLLTPSDKSVKRYEQVSQQTRYLKLLAREVQIPIVVLCQLNRQPADENSSPQLHHLRESGSIEQDADTVILLHRPEEGIWIPDTSEGAKKNQKIKAAWPAELIVAKQRNGSTGRFKLNWEPASTRFSCWDNQQVQHSTASYSEFSEYSGTEESW